MLSEIMKDFKILFCKIEIEYFSLTLLQNCIQKNQLCPFLHFGSSQILQNVEYFSGFYGHRILQISKSKPHEILFRIKFSSRENFAIFLQPYPCDA